MTTSLVLIVVFIFVIASVVLGVFLSKSTNNIISLTPITSPVASTTPITSPLTFIILYDDNKSTSGSSPIDASLYEEFDTVTVVGHSSLVKTNFIFKEWNTLADGTGTAYVSGQTLQMGAQDVVLYAQWVEFYTVIYDGNESTSGSSPIDASLYEEFDTVTVVGHSSLVKTNFIFKEWNTLADGTGTAYVSGQTLQMGAQDIVLYAQWVEFYTVIYDGNESTSGSSPVDASLYEEFDTVTVVGQASLVKTNFIFQEWNTLADGTGTTYLPSDQFPISVKAQCLIKAQTGTAIDPGYDFNDELDGEVTFNVNYQEVFGGITIINSFFIDTSPVATQEMLANNVQNSVNALLLGITVTVNQNGFLVFTAENYYSLTVNNFAQQGRDATAGLVALGLGDGSQPYIELSFSGIRLQSNFVTLYAKWV
jgi:hypothetical protein